MEYAVKQNDPARIFRAAVLNGVEPPYIVRATLEARGINTAEVERRLREELGMRQ